MLTRKEYTMQNYYTNEGVKIYNPEAYAKTGAPMYTHI